METKNNSAVTTNNNNGGSQMVRIELNGMDEARLHKQIISRVDFDFQGNAHYSLGSVKDGALEIEASCGDIISTAEWGKNEVKYFVVKGDGSLVPLKDRDEAFSVKVSQAYESVEKAFDILDWYVKFHKSQDEELNKALELLASVVRK